MVVGWARSRTPSRRRDRSHAWPSAHDRPRPRRPGLFPRRVDDRSLPRTELARPSIGWSHRHGCAAIRLRCRSLRHRQHAARKHRRARFTTRPCAANFAW